MNDKVREAVEKAMVPYKYPMIVGAICEGIEAHAAESGPNYDCAKKLIDAWIRWRKSDQGSMTLLDTVALLDALASPKQEPEQPSEPANRFPIGDAEKLSEKGLCEEITKLRSELATAKKRAKEAESKLQQQENQK